MEIFTKKLVGTFPEIKYEIFRKIVRSSNTIWMCQ